MELARIDWGDIIYEILLGMANDSEFLLEEIVAVDCRQYDYNIFEQPEDY
jgi:hypothetical protein